ncbi:MAG: (d)CMP kinase [Bradymonadales bacterium]|nr:MAG: (d)CMP kinase [Bradymonadales bacterium]
MIITIDGPAGSGKSTVAKRLARYFCLPYIDTGAMYRSVAYRAIQLGKSLEDIPALVEIAERLEFEFRFQDGDYFTAVSESGGEFVVAGDEIRSPEVSMASSKIAQWAELRSLLVRKQQASGRQKGGVLEGRDAGTVIFPEADLKFFLTASAEERAQRRHRELLEKMGKAAPSFENVLKDVSIRDQQDQGRKASPLMPASDAIRVDSSRLDEDQVFDRLAKRIQAYIQADKAQDATS